jgi:TetR/AcrR family transcriptional regulator, transcriptional repressor for nem operon
MISKGQRTRTEIIQRSAVLMNRQGFLAAPMSAVVEATGIQKGGLYRHFESRDALAYEAFDFAVSQIRQRFMHALEGWNGACEQLLALLNAYGDSTADLPFPGGCPIMNAAVEADHAHPGLRRRAQAAMKAWHQLLQRIVEAGIQAGEIRPGTDPAQVATVFIACIEGAVMLTHLHGNTVHFEVSREHLKRYVERELREPPKSES